MKAVKNYRDRRLTKARDLEAYRATLSDVLRNLEKGEEEHQQQIAEFIEREYSRRGGMKKI